MQGGKIGYGSTIHTPVKFFSVRRNIIIGRNVTVNPDCYLDDRGGISIGNNVNISHDVRIYTSGHNINSGNLSYFESPVKIEDDVWIFPNVLVMPGVTLRKRTIVLPGAVVTKTYPEGSVIGGNPSKLISKRTKPVEYLIEHEYWFVS